MLCIKWQQFRQFGPKHFRLISKPLVSNTINFWKYSRFNWERSSSSPVCSSTLIMLLILTVLQNRSPQPLDQYFLSDWNQHQIRNKVYNKCKALEIILKPSLQPWSMEKLSAMNRSLVPKRLGTAALELSSKMWIQDTLTLALQLFPSKFYLLYIPSDFASLIPSTIFYLLGPSPIIPFSNSLFSVSHKSQNL